MLGVSHFLSHAKARVDFLMLLFSNIMYFLIAPILSMCPLGAKMMLRRGYGLGLYVSDRAVVKRAHMSMLLNRSATCKDVHLIDLILRLRESIRRIQAASLMDLNFRPPAPFHQLSSAQFFTSTHCFTCFDYP